MLFPPPARIPLKSDRAGDSGPQEGRPHASNLLNSGPSSLQGAKKSSSSQRSGRVPALPCPALRPHACPGLHKGHTRAQAEVGGGEETKGTPSQRHSRPRDSSLRAGVPEEAQAGEGAAPGPPAPFGPRTPPGPAPSPRPGPAQPLLQLILPRLRPLGVQPEDAAPAWHAPGSKGHSGTRA